jgi:predicted O-linked N-acetylglucosamine transferase (SPINDLY family)
LIAAAGQWRSLVGLSDEAAADLVASDAIDILVDLSGHTAGNRLALFARKPAPLQASWLGFWGTTGMAAIDYILSDQVTIPDRDVGDYSERVLRLPGCRFCYGPPEEAPPPSAPPSLARHYPTFGSFNNIAKLGPEVVALWAELLHRVPDAKLLLKWRSLADQGLRESIIRQFADGGISPHRLELRGASPHREMLAEYGDIDIALDPFPFSGGLTSCEALWMGVPVITLPGSTAPSRQTLSILTALGRQDWAAGSAADFIDLAARLAADRHSLETIRSDLRGQMAASPLCDGPALTAGLEAAYRSMWRSWCGAD